jgi:membrane-bound serine protease (ClpP class)
MFQYRNLFKGGFFLLKKFPSYKTFILSILSIILCSLSLHSGEKFTLEGHLDEKALSPINKYIDGLTPKAGDFLVIKLNSSSGSLDGVLELSKKLYLLKKQKVDILVYIDDKAVGPAAIIPFVATERAVAPFVSWGDIQSSAEKLLPVNILRSQVLSLLDRNDPEYENLRRAAEGMLDSSVEVTFPGNTEILSKKGEALILNSRQIESFSFSTKSSDWTKEEKESFVTEKKENLSGEDAANVPATGLFSEKIKFVENEENTVGYIAIDDFKHGINQSTWIYVKSALDYYKKNKPRFIILLIDSPGGEVFAAQKISDALKDFDVDTGIPIVAVIDNRAFSAGAMLAYSCRYITATKEASMGAAEPVLLGEGGKMQSASEKINSALRTDFANRAKFYNRNPLIAEAMVDKDLILVMRYGQILKLDSEDQIRTSGPNPDKVIIAKGKIMTLNAEQMTEYKVSDAILPTTSVPERTFAELSTGSWDTSKERLFLDPFFKALPKAKVKRYIMDWQTRFFAVLVSPMVASMLVMGMMIGFYMEMNSPGFGLPGSVSVLCFMLMVLSSFALDAIGFLEIILILMGIALIIADVTLIPTFGLLGSVGVIFFFVGLMGLLLPGLESVSFDFDSQTFNAAGDAVLDRFIYLCGALILSTIAILLLARYVTPRLLMFSRLVQVGEQEASEGYVAGLLPDEMPKLNSSGVAETMLRPAGKVVIANVLYDAVSSGKMIEKGEKIIVTAIEGNRVIVDNEAIYKGMDL